MSERRPSTGNLMGLVAVVAANLFLLTQGITLLLGQPLYLYLFVSLNMVLIQAVVREAAEALACDFSDLDRHLCLALRPAAVIAGRESLVVLVLRNDRRRGRVLPHCDARLRSRSPIYTDPGKFLIICDRGRHCRIAGPPAGYPAS